MNAMENGGNVTKAMRDAKYSETTINNPKNLTESIAWKELMEEHLPDRLLSKTHKELMQSTKIEHMVFPTAMTDDDITKLLAGVNCVPKKFMHGDTANHVWYWASNDKARKDALDMAYKLKGHYAAEKKEFSGGLSLTSLFDETCEDD